RQADFSRGRFDAGKRGRGREKSSAVRRGCFQRRGIRARKKRSRKSEGVHQGGKICFMKAGSPKIRCPWPTNENSIHYHDTEWGVPIHDDRLLFEYLILEGAQAGLSWETILKKRENYRTAFDQFDPAVIANYGQKKGKSLLSDAGIIRNR